MILWILQGADPEGMFETGEVTCSLERAEDGFLLVVSHEGDVQVHESHGTVESAQGKAEALRQELMALGFRETDAW